MSISLNSESKAFFNLSSDISDPAWADFQSLRGRIHCVSVLLEKILILPLAVFYKLYKTLSRCVGLLLAAACVLITLGTSQGSRDFFVRRVSSLSRDLADWILYPFAVLTCFGKLVLASLFHPALHLRF